MKRGIAFITALSCLAAPVYAETASEKQWYAEHEMEEDDFSELVYAGVHAEELEEMADQLKVLGTAQSGPDFTEDIRLLLHEIEDEYDLQMNQYILSMIRSSRNVVDEEVQENLLSDEQEILSVNDTILEAVSEVLNGPYAEVAAKELPDYVEAEDYAMYEELPDEFEDLISRENELVRAYFTVMDQEFSVEAQDREWTLQDLYEDIPEDYSVTQEILEKISRKENEEAGPIFQELIKLRTRIAEEAGYDSFIEYAYEGLYNRDYSPEEVQNVREEVKTTVVPLYESLLFLYLLNYDQTLEETEVRDVEEILDQLAVYLPEIDPSLMEAFSYMREHGFYDCDQSEEKADESYTIGLYGGHGPFIFSRLTGTYTDYSTVLHEFGHYNAMFHGGGKALYAADCVDVDEIHSQGLELLFLPYYQRILGENAGKTMMVDRLVDIITSVLQGFAYDEFEQKVYENPDMTLQEMNALMGEILYAYGLGVEDTEDYTWTETSHFFQQPFYYISYATAALTALEIWETSLEDREKGTDLYMEITTFYNGVTFGECLERTGLRNPLTHGGITECAQNLQDVLVNVLDMQIFGTQEEELPYVNDPVAA